MDDKLTRKLAVPSQGRLYYIRYAMKLGYSRQRICEITKIDPWFIDQIARLVWGEATDDKLLPPVSEMVESIGRLAFEEDRRSGEIVLWADTAASMQRLLMGLAIATLIGLAFGLTLGLIPVAGAGLGTFVAVLSMIPPMARP